jgi:hypothetical protein
MNGYELGKAHDELYMTHRKQKKRLADQDNILNKISYGILIVRLKENECSVRYLNKELNNLIPFTLPHV